MFLAFLAPQLIFSASSIKRLTGAGLLQDIESPSYQLLSYGLFSANACKKMEPDVCYGKGLAV
jgi:hypothetical protein